VLRFFEAVRRGDEVGAFACWENDIREDEHRKYVENIVANFTKSLCANFRFEEAIAKKFPVRHREMRDEGETAPGDEKISAAQFTVYRRLAIVRWGKDEEDGFPMVLDNRDQARPVWKISMQQWYEANRSSVGDSMLGADFLAKATDLTTKEILEGKYHSLEAVGKAYLRHWEEMLHEVEKEGR